MSDRAQLQDRACTACGCLCDDIVVTTESDRVVSHENLCPLGEQWYQAGLAVPSHEVDGQPASLDEAVTAAASVLNGARAPMVYGLRGLSVDCVRAATELADRAGAVIAPECSALDRAVTRALQTVGMSTATFGEIRHRADTIVFWRADPASEQPRFWERFVDPAGKTVPGGRVDREVWCIDDRQSETAALSDHHLAPGPRGDLPSVWHLRAQVEGSPVEQSSQQPHNESLGLLAQRLKESRYSAFVLGDGVAKAENPCGVVEGLFRLVRSLNTDTRSVVVPLHAAGGLPALQWASGAAGPVDYAGGAPRAELGTAGGLDLLTRGEVDAALLVGDGRADRLTTAEREALNATRTVVLGGAASWEGLKPKVRLGTLTPGVTADGQAFRADGVALPLRRVLQRGGLTPAEALRRLRAALTR